MEPNCCDMGRACSDAGSIKVLARCSRAIMDGRSSPVNTLDMMMINVGVHKGTKINTAACSAFVLYGSRDHL